MDALNYLLLVNIYLVLFYGFYVLLLKDETFFKLNRIYLVGGASLSFLIPFLQPEWIRSLFITKQVEAVTQNISLTFSNEAVIIPAEEQAFQAGQIILFIYLAGAMLGLLRFLWQLYKVQSILKSEQADHAFSFFTKVKVGDAVPNRNTVYDHELVHARQWHSADVILFEIISIINWFNPVVYLYHKAIKHIHEFTADEIASCQEESKSAYAVILLSKTFGIPTHQLTNSFYNQSLLKQRIIMLHKSKSNRTALLKYGLSVPLFAAMMVLSSASISNKIESVDRVLMDPAVNEGTITTTTAHLKPVLEEVPLALEAIPFRETNKSQDTTLFTSVEVSPEFPGGMKKFYDYLSKSFRYPDAARKNDISGKIIVHFVVEQSGKLSNIKILRGLGSGLDEEAVRVLTEGPSWKPGIQNGRPVRVAYTLPISINTKVKPDSLKAGNSPDDRMGITNANPNLLYVVDGKEMSAAQFKSKMKPDMIGSINVLKGEKATQKYGDRGKEGVLEIATRGYSTAGTIKPTDSGNQNISSTTMSSGNMEAKKEVTISMSDKLPARALYIIDGKKYNVKDGTEKLKAISPNDIESMNVIKGERAVKEFGVEGKEGVIQITLKNK